MSTHSIESRAYPLRPQHRLSSQAPVMHSTIPNFYPKPSTETKSTFRRCQSASSLPHRQTHQNYGQLSELEIKYRVLEEDYRKMLQQVRNRAELFAHQKQEIQRLTLVTQKEDKEISRLKQMLRLTKKKDFAIQTGNMEVDDYYYMAERENSSWRKRMEDSTGESKLTQETRCERESHIRRQTHCKNKERVRPSSSSKKHEAVAPVEVVVDKNKFKESRVCKAGAKEKNPLIKKCKFVPTLAFKHI